MPRWPSLPLQSRFVLGLSLTLSVVHQARERLFGHGCSAAEWHEQSGPANAVHVSAAVMAALDRASSAAAVADLSLSPPALGGEGGLRRSSSLWSIATSDAEPSGDDGDDDTGGREKRGPSSCIRRKTSFVLLPDEVADGHELLSLEVAASC